VIVVAVEMTLKGVQAEPPHWHQESGFNLYSLIGEVRLIWKAKAIPWGL
jgi:hypothetical protein